MGYCIRGLLLERSWRAVSSPRIIIMAPLYKPLSSRRNHLSNWTPPYFSCFTPNVRIQGEVDITRQGWKEECHFIPLSLLTTTRLIPNTGPNNQPVGYLEELHVDINIGSSTRRTTHHSWLDKDLRRTFLSKRRKDELTRLWALRNRSVPFVRFPEIHR